MDEIVPLDGTNLVKLLTETSVSNKTLTATVVQIATLEVFRLLGLECECRAPYIDGKIPDAYAKKRITLNQALLLAVHLDILEKGNSGDPTRLQKERLGQNKKETGRATTASTFVKHRIQETDVEFLLNAVFTKVNLQ